MKRILTILTIAMLLISSLSIVASSPIPIDEEETGDNHQEYDESDNFFPLSTNEDIYNLPSFDSSSLPYNGEQFSIDAQGKFISNIETSDITNNIGGDEGSSISENGTNFLPDRILIKSSMEKIYFPPMTKGEVCGMSETEILNDLEISQMLNPDDFFTCNPVAFKNFSIWYPDKGSINYTIHVSYDAPWSAEEEFDSEEDIELAMHDRGWVKLSQNSGTIGDIESDESTTPGWGNAVEHEDVITVKINITDLSPRRHIAYIVICPIYDDPHSPENPTQDLCGPPDYNITIPVIINIWPPTNDESLKYSLLGCESVYEYDAGSVNEGCSLSVIADSWSIGPENTTAICKIEFDSFLTAPHAHFMCPEAVAEFDAYSRSMVSIEPDGQFASTGEHNYARIRITVPEGWLMKMLYFREKWFQSWGSCGNIECPPIPIPRLFDNGALDPSFKFKVWGPQNSVYHFVINFHVTACITHEEDRLPPMVMIKELPSFEKSKTVPQGETVHLLDTITWNPSQIQIYDVDPTVYYSYFCFLVDLEAYEYYFRNDMYYEPGSYTQPPPEQTWVGDGPDEKHVRVIPNKYSNRGVLYPGGSPGGDTLREIKGRDINNFYVDTTGLEPGKYMAYIGYIAECPFWTINTDPDGDGPEEGFAGVGVLPAIDPASCIFTVESSNWETEEEPHLERFVIKNMQLDNLDTFRYKTCTVTEGNVPYEDTFQTLNAIEVNISSNENMTQSLLVNDCSIMFDIYPKKTDYTKNTDDTRMLPSDKVIIIPRSDGYRPPYSDDPDSSFEERGGDSGYAPIIANPFTMFDQLVYINGQMSHIEPPPLYSTIKTQVLNPVDGEWIDIQDSRRRNPHTGDWVSQLEDVPVGTTLTFRIEVFIRDFHDGPAGGNGEMAGCGKLVWPLQIENILPENLVYEEDSAKTRLGAWWKMRDPMACGGTVSESDDTDNDTDNSTCFLKDTKILMADSTTKNIEEIIIGDLVKSFNEGNNSLVNGEVVQVFHHGSEETDNYLVINNDLKVTPNHPIYKNGIWIPAIELRKGEVLKFKDNTYEINSIKKVFEKVPTYNFEVRTYHNYIVSMEEGSLLVHNTKDINPNGTTNCFLENTRVSMADNSHKNIEEITVGNFVKSYDEQTKNIVEGQVNKIFKHDKEIMADYYLIINNDLRVTPDHPIYKDGRWIAAGKLVVGDIIGFDGNFYEIFSIEKIFEQVTTYNFEVEKYHNYMVKSKDGDVLVHNGGSYHPEYEGESYFSWAEKFTPFEPSIERKNLIWDLPTGYLIKSQFYNMEEAVLESDFSLFDQPTCHPHAGSSPIWPYHPTATWAVATTGAVAVEIVFNATINDIVDIDEIITNEADLKVLDFFDHYYINQDIQQINNDTASVTLKNSNLPPNRPEIISPFDGETGLSVKYTDELLVRVTDPDNDLMSVSFYWTDKPRFSICMDPRASEPGSDRPPMIDAPVATAYEFGCHGTRIETVYNVPSGAIVSVDPRPIAYFDEKLSSGIFGKANIKYLEYDTQYEWYVVVKDMKDTVRSDISSFSTDDKPPEADFTFMPEELHTGELVTFDALPSHDPDDVIFKYMWTYEPVGGFIIPDKGTGGDIDDNPDDGDNDMPDWYNNMDPIHGPGIIGTGEKIDYIFNDTGDYKVKLRVYYDRYESLTYGEHIRDHNVLSRWPYYSTVTKIIDVTEGTVQDKYPPVVEGIPDQTITMGDSFDLIYLDSYVEDSESNDEEIVWSVSGNENFFVSIVDRVATITYPSIWNGGETITFIGTDLDGFSDSDDAVFTVLPIGDNNPPVISLMAPVNGAEDVSVDISMVSVNIIDLEGDVFDWSIETVPDIGSNSAVSDSDGTKTLSISEELQYDTSYTWFVNVTDPSGSGIYTRAIYTFTTELENSGDDDDEIEDCNVEILKPLENFLYINNIEKCSFFIPIIIGDVEISVAVSDPNHGVACIKFYIDDEEKKSVTNPTQETYSYMWDEKAFFWKTIKVIATDAGGKQIASDSIDVIMFNLEG